LRSLARRRAANAGILVAASLLTVLGVRALSLRLYRTSLITGWLLFTLIVSLALFSVRKKLSFVPLGRASAWLQFHVHAGLFTALLLALHTDWRVPNGVLEGTLAAVFTAVVMSGIVGIFISRNFARRLTSRGQEVIFERIPRLRRRLEERAQELALASVTEDGTTAIADFYTKRLVAYFRGPRNALLHLVDSRRPRLSWTSELSAMERYLDEGEKRRAAELLELILMKDDLDYHYALQGTLKAWLFVHIPLTYAVLVLALAHGLLAQAFMASVR
jgi:hypothetical protein